MRVRDTAVVRVSQPVNGQPRRRGQDKRARQPATVTTALPIVMAAARQAQRPGERLVVVSTTVVELRPE